MTAVQPGMGYVRYLATETAEKALSPNVRRLGAATLNLIDTVKRLTAERDTARSLAAALEQEGALKDEALAELRALHRQAVCACGEFGKPSMHPACAICDCTGQWPCDTARILDALAARLSAHLFPADEVCSSCGAPLDSLGCVRGEDGRPGHTTGGGCEANPTDEEGASDE